MAFYASGEDKFKAVEYVETCLRILSLFCVITSRLSNRLQYVLLHSPFPHLLLRIFSK
jgi:hypothetical protein